jgi:hypothetical protein
MTLALGSHLEGDGARETRSRAAGPHPAQLAGSSRPMTMSMSFVERVAPCAVTAMPPHTAYGIFAAENAAAIAWNLGDEIHRRDRTIGGSRRRRERDRAEVLDELLGRRLTRQRQLRVQS